MPRSHHARIFFYYIFAKIDFLFFHSSSYLHLPRYYVVGRLPASTPILNGFSGISPRYSLSRNPFTHCGKISPVNIPSWYVPFLLSTIQNGLVHWNWSLLGIEPIFVWNTNTSFPISNIFSFCFRRRSTNVFVCLCFCSNAHRAWSQLSSNTNQFSFLTHSDCSSSNLLVIWTRSVRIWNSTGITTSSPNAIRNRVDLITVLYEVRYAHKALWSFWSQ